MNKILAFGVTLFCLFKSNESLNPRGYLAKYGPKLVIDHDGGADDAMALFLSFYYEKYYNGPSVIGLTTVNGNVNETQVFENSQRILDIAGRRDVPIYRGSVHSLVIPVETDHYFGYDGLGDNDNVYYENMQAGNSHAVMALIEMSKKYPGELTVMAIGPLTNIALAIRLDPEFIDRLAQLYVGAGHIHNEVNKEPEFNAELDVEAYHVVVQNANKHKVTVVPYSQVMVSLNISKEWRTDVLGAIPTKVMKAQNSFERLSLPKSDDWIPLDPAVAAIILDERVINEVKYSKNDIIICGDQRGLNTNDFESKEPNVKIIYSANKEFYQDFLVHVFSKELRC